MKSKKLELGHWISLILIFLLFTPARLIANGDIRITVQNINGTSTPLPGSNGTVILYDKNWTTSTSLKTNTSGIATFTNRVFDNYNAEAYHTPSNPSTIFGTEFWGGINFNHNSNPTSITIRRHLPYFSSFIVYNNSTNVNVTGGTVPTGTQLRIVVRVVNPSVVDQTVRTRLVIDRDKVTSYDFDQTSSSSNVNANNGTKDYIFYFTPNTVGEYYAVAGTQTYINNSWSLTDGAAWASQALFTVQAPAPTAPTAISADSYSTSSFRARWNSATNATGYRLDVSTNSSFSSFVTGYQNKDVFNNLNHTVSGLNPGTTYYYRVRAYNSGGASSNSNTITAITNPNAPNTLDATNITTTGFRANWGSVNGAVKYRLDVSTNSSFSSFLTGYNNRDVGNITYFNVSGLSSGTDYYYRVRAENAISGTSTNSQTKKVTTDATSGTINVTVRNIDGTSTPLPSSNGSVVLYDGSWNILTEVATNSSGVASFTNRSFSTYNIEAYHKPNNPTTIFGTEFWGGAKIDHNTSPTSTIITRHMPHTQSFIVINKATGQEVTGGNIIKGTELSIRVRAANPGSVAQTIRARLVLDRDKLTTYDFDQTSVSTTVNGSNATKDIEFTFTTNTTGTFYAVGAIQTSLSNGYALTDGTAWSNIPLFTVIDPTGTINVTVKNIDGTSTPLPGSNGTVVLYDGSWNILTEVATNSSGLASFTNRSFGTYNIEAYHKPNNPTTIFGTEFWGGVKIEHNTNPTTTTITRHMPHTQSFIVINKATGHEVTGGNIIKGTELSIRIRAANPGSVAQTIRARLVLDRDKLTTYDFDQTSGSTTINGNNATKDIEFNLTPNTTGTFYAVGAIHTSLSNGYALTDGTAWANIPLFTVIDPTGTINVTVRNIDETSTPLPGSNGSVVLYDGSWNRLTEIATNTSGVASFTNRSFGTYNIEAYHKPNNPTTIFGTEFWGGAKIDHNNSPTSTTITRHMPHSQSFIAINKSTGQEVTGGNIIKGTELSIRIRAANPGSVAQTIRARLVLDRDKLTTYDFDQTSVSTTINANNATKDIEFTFTPNTTGTFYAVGAIHTSLSNGYALTDGTAWATDPLFNVIDQEDWGIGNIISPIAGYPINGKHYILREYLNGKHMLVFEKTSTGEILEFEQDVIGAVISMYAISKIDKGFNFIEDGVSSQVNRWKELTHIYEDFQIIVDTEYYKERITKARWSSGVITGAMAVAGVGALVSAPFTGGASILGYAALAGSAGIGLFSLGNTIYKSTGNRPKEIEDQYYIPERIIYFQTLPYIYNKEPEEIDYDNHTYAEIESFIKKSGLSTEDILLILNGFKYSYKLGKLINEGYKIKVTGDIVPAKFWGSLSNFGAGIFGSVSKLYINSQTNKLRNDYHYLYCLNDHHQLMSHLSYRNSLAYDILNNSLNNTATDLYRSIQSIPDNTNFFQLNYNEIANNERIVKLSIGDINEQVSLLFSKYELVPYNDEKNLANQKSMEINNKRQAFRIYFGELEETINISYLNKNVNDYKQNIEIDNSISDLKETMIATNKSYNLSLKNICDEPISLKYITIIPENNSIAISNIQFNTNPISVNNSSTVKLNVNTLGTDEKELFNKQRLNVHLTYLKNSKEIQQSLFYDFYLIPDIKISVYPTNSFLFKPGDIVELNIEVESVNNGSLRLEFINNYEQGGVLDNISFNAGLTTIKKSWQIPLNSKSGTYNAEIKSFSSNKTFVWKQPRVFTILPKITGDASTFDFSSVSIISSINDFEIAQKLEDILPNSKILYSEGLTAEDSLPAMQNDNLILIGGDQANDLVDYLVTSNKIPSNLWQSEGDAHVIFVDDPFYPTAPSGNKAIVVAGYLLEDTYYSGLSLFEVLNKPKIPIVNSATSITQKSFTANWNATSNATGYYLDISTSSTFSSFVSGFNNKNVGNVLSASATSLTAGTNYYYRIRAYNSSGTSENSVTVKVLTIPPNPVAISASNISQISFTTNWNAAKGVSGYYLDISTTNTFSTFISGYKNKDVGNVLSLPISGLNTGQTYYYRVRAYNESGISENSNIIEVTTTAANSLVLVPSAPGIVWQQGTTYNVTWSGFGGANVKIELMKGSAVQSTIIASASNSGSYPWTVPTTIEASNDYMIRVTSVENPSETDLSDNNFAIQPVEKPVITIVVNAPPIAETIDPAGDFDWYRFQTGAAGSYVVQTFGTTDTYMGLFQDDGTSLIVVDNDSGEATNARITRTLAANTWYRVKVRGNLASTTGNYTIGVTGPPSIITLTVDDPAIAASISFSGDFAWYRFQTGVAGSYVIQTFGTTDTYMGLFQDDGTTVISTDNDSGEGTNARITRNLAANTWYRVKIRGILASTTGNYTIGVTGPPSIITLTVDAPAVAASVNFSGDFAWYRFQTGVAGSYVIQTFGTTDTYMGLFQDNGTTVISTDNDSGEGTNARITRNLAANTWYRVKVRGNLASTTGNYTIGVTGPPSIITLTVDAPAISAAINPAGDIDWYRFQTGLAGQYTVQTFGTTDTYMGLFQDDGTTVISTDNDSGEGTNSRIIRNLAANTWYRVRIRGNLASTTGNYTIGVSALITLTVDAAPTAAAIDQAGDFDWYRFRTGPAGQYTVQTFGSTDTYMGLFQYDGTTIISTDNDSGEGTNSRIIRNLAANTWYTVRVRGSIASTTGNYTIGVSALITLTVDAAPTAAAIDQAGDFDWYRFRTGPAGLYTIQTFGTTDTYMGLFQYDGTTIISTDDDSGEGTNARIVRNLVAETWHTVRIRGYKSTITGNYTIQVSTGSTAAKMASIIGTDENGINITMLRIYPNPFSERVTIGYSIAEKGRTLVEIFDLTGRRVTTLQDALQEAGSYELQWDATDAAGQQVISGIYLCRIQSGGFVKTEKIIFNR